MWYIFTRYVLVIDVAMPSMGCADNALLVTDAFFLHKSLVVIEILSIFAKIYVIVWLKRDYYENMDYDCHPLHLWSNISSGEDLSKMLADLVYCDLISHHSNGGKMNSGIYRLTDFEKRYATETTQYYIYSDSNPADNGLHGKRQPESKWRPWHNGIHPWRQHCAGSQVYRRL